MEGQTTDKQPENIVRYWTAVTVATYCWQWKHNNNKQWQK